MQFFITATGTDIGKTFVLENFCRRLIREGKMVEAVKPVISGFQDGDLNNDCVKILTALGRKINPKNIAEISPYRFLAPLSPNLAADLENKKIDFDDLTKFCQDKISDAKKNNHHLFIEGAGGVMTPITNDKTFADLISALNIPTILVVGGYLGTISHTLTAITAMQANKIEIAQIILNCRNGDQENYAPILKTLQGFVDIKIHITHLN